MRACTQRTAAAEARFLFAGQADGGSRKEELAEQIETDSLSSFLIVGFNSCLGSEMLCLCEPQECASLSRATAKNCAVETRSVKCMLDFWFDWNCKTLYCITYILNIVTADILTTIKISWYKGEKGKR